MKNIKSKRKFTVLQSSLAAFAVVSVLAMPALARNGESGRNGRDGSSGQNVTVTADGSPKSVVIRGEHGTAGYPGSNGSSGQDCLYFGQFSAEDGGDGGDGGRGGDGGNGGNVTLYTTDLSALRSVQIDSSPGFGAPGAGGGYGASGGLARRSTRVVNDTVCRDYYIPITEQICDPVTIVVPGVPPHRNCRTVVRQQLRRECHPVTRVEESYCRAGSNGRDGSSGRSGYNGRVGSLTLIEKSETLPAEAPSVSKTLSQLLSAPVTLTKHLWGTQSGALSLLAPGSVIQDVFTRYLGTATSQVSLQAQVSRDLSALQNLPLALHFDSKSTSLSAGSNVILRTTKQEESGTAQFTINAIATNDEILNIRLKGSSGVRGNFSLIFEDALPFKDLVETKISLKLYRDRSAWFDSLIFEGDVTNRIQRNGNEISVELGNDVSNRRYVKPGKRLRAEVQIERTFAGQTLSKSQVEEIVVGE